MSPDLEFGVTALTSREGLRIVEDASAPATATPLQSVPAADPFDIIVVVTKRRLVPPLLRGHAALFWAVSFVCASVLTSALALQQDARATYQLLCMTLLVGALLLVPAALHFCSKLFLDWAKSIGAFVKLDAQAIRHWYNGELKFFEGSWAMFIAGAVLGALALFAYVQGRYLDPFTFAGRVWAGLVIFGAAFMAGCGLFAMCCACVAVHRLGRIGQHAMVVVPGRFGIVGTGRVLAQCWMFIGAVWFVYSASAVFGPSHGIGEVLRTPPVLLVALPILPLVIGCFIACQWPIHLGMLEFKRAELQRLDAMLHQLKPTSIDDLAEDRREKIEFLMKRRSEIDALPEWPFSTKALAGVSGSAASAVTPIFLKAMLPAVFRQVAPAFGAE